MSSIQCSCGDPLCNERLGVVKDDEKKGNTLIKILGGKFGFGTFVSLTREDVQELIAELKRVSK